MRKIHIFDHKAYHDALEHQIGHGIPVFNGYRQKGGGLGSIIGFLGKYAIPLLSKYVFPHATSAIIDTVDDLVAGQSFKGTLKKRSKELLKNVGKSILKPQSGGRIGTSTKRVGLKRLTSFPCETPKKKLKVSISDSPLPKKLKRKKQPPKKQLSKIDIFG